MLDAAVAQPAVSRASVHEYRIHCHRCRGPMDAMSATWCECLATERTLVCPWCQTCFCKAPVAYQRRFWSEAPREMWDRKFNEHHLPFVPPKAPADPGQVQRPLVLVVEDEMDTQRIAARVVGGLGYGMLLATNGVEGLELARRYKPDLVLSDALMPRMDGRDLCMRLKADPATAQVKVVVMTSLYTGTKYRNMGFKNYKVDDYVEKPLSCLQLRELFERHLG